MGDQLDYDFQPIGVIRLLQSEVTIRHAISEDGALIRALIQELAEYDGEARHVRTTEADIARDGLERVYLKRLSASTPTSFIAATDQRHVVIYSLWRDLASVEGMRTNPDMVAYFRDRRLAAFVSFVGDVVYNHHA